MSGAEHGGAGVYFFIEMLLLLLLCVCYLMGKKSKVR